MKLYNSFKLYKKNIYTHRFFLFIFLLIFGLSIILDSFVCSLESNSNIYDLQLVYNNLSLYRQWLYIAICTIITFKIISFADSQLYVLRLESKDNVWNLVTYNIVVTNFIISLYLVTLSYICGLVFSNKDYMGLNKTIILLIILIILITIGLSLFNMITVIIKNITGSKTIAYLFLMAILVIEVLSQENSLALYDLSFNTDYLENTPLSFFNMIKFLGITILLFELGRLFYRRKEVYNTKKILMNGSCDEK